jgi:prepilin-type N-terminal cleavage/methylation domain-containing protein
VRIFRHKIFGFTLVELLIVVAIIGVLSVIGGISLNSRIAISRLEEAAKTLVSDLRNARSSAMFKGCPVRFIHCADKTCSTTAATGRNVVLMAGVSGTSGNFIGTSTGVVASYYGILRMSQKANTSGTCYNSAAVNALDSPTDAYNYWDFDRRPQSIPKGVAFSSVYSPNAVLDFGGDWFTTTEPGAANSLWFSASSGVATIPTGGATASNGDTIAFQLNLDGCDPRSSSSECLGYLITVGAGGVVNMVKCSPGARSVGVTNSDVCF